MEWEPGEIRWYVDGALRHQSRKEIPDVPMFLLVNPAVGGWVEASDSITVFPADFESDLVRVWETKIKSYCSYKNFKINENIIKLAIFYENNTN